MGYTNLIFSRFDFVLLQIVLQETEIMNQGKTVFAQIMSLIPRYKFDKSTLLPDQQAMSNQRRLTFTNVK